MSGILPQTLLTAVHSSNPEAGKRGLHPGQVVSTGGSTQHNWQSFGIHLGKTTGISCRHLRVAPQDTLRRKGGNVSRAGNPPPSRKDLQRMAAYCSGTEGSESSSAGRHGSFQLCVA